MHLPLLYGHKPKFWDWWHSTIVGHSQHEAAIYDLRLNSHSDEIPNQIGHKSELESTHGESTGVWKAEIIAYK